jgi:hypothetical protein
MNVILWVASQALWISLIGAICSVFIRFEKSLPKRLHKVLLAASIFITLATPLLGLLKKSLDDQWKIEMQTRIDAAVKASQPKPLRERLIDQLNFMDKAVLQRLATGQTNFSGIWGPAAYSDLERLASEPGADKYISFHPGPSMQSGAAAIMGARYELSPSLLKP